MSCRSHTSPWPFCIRGECPPSLRVSFVCESVNADALALFGCLFEPYLSVNQGEQGVVSSYSDITTGLHDRAPLAHQDRAGPHHRAIAALDAQPLAWTVPTVAGATNAFLMGHGCVYASCEAGGCSASGSSSGGGPASPA